MSLRYLLLGTALAAPLALTSLSAAAASVTYSSNGTLSSIAGCTNPATCVQNGQNQIYWGGQNGFGGSPSPYISSVLTAVDAGTTTDLDGQNVTLGQLNWTNRATADNRTDDSFNVTWSLSNIFTSPVGLGSAAFNLNIQNTQNPAGDLILNLLAASYTANIPGYVMTGLHFEEEGRGSFNSLTGIWTNPEGYTSTLRLLANVVTAPVPVPVPEPASLALFGAGLLGLGLVRQRKNSSAI
ncbi:PEP-CTERM sorting domain-containing protein [Roseomonas nepalensis]|uniref:PEP-CTERM sorting domain-containing protein n=1 Tax=Muricoccus nepalensis TaxID=1854500 RepID=A0A502EJ19_9PROT|nr:choice-of-anchor K domain-containing protein [Roseomonas nepalensis]TPG37705.1 PEP-CTERM sorting domain-containing protein [Roseomonas nepalensis]